MTPLPAPFHRVLTAVEGWLELGLPNEASSELDRIPPHLHGESGFLEARFAVCAHRSEWDSAYDLAERRVQNCPDDAGGWIHRAYAARRRNGGGLAEAFALLHPAIERFPDEAIIPYNLACYCTQQAELNEAWKWLELAATIGGTELIRRMALSDADLCPLWNRIAALR